MDPLERPANRPTIEPATNPDPNTLYLDSPHDENITSLLDALAEDACNADENVAPAGKKRTLAKDACNADENVAMAGKKRTWGKIALLSNRDVALAGKKKTQRKGKVRPKEKRRHIKKTLSVIGSETYKTKLDSEEELSFKVSNADSVVRPAFGLSNTNSEAELGSGNGEVEELGVELIVMMCSVLIGLLRVFLYLSTSSELLMP